MNLDKWNQPPECKDCERKHWGNCEYETKVAHVKHGGNGTNVTVIQPPALEEQAKPDWQGVSHENPRKNRTEILKEPY